MAKRKIEAIVAGARLAEISEPYVAASMCDDWRLVVLVVHWGQVEIKIKHHKIEQGEAKTWLEAAWAAVKPDFDQVALILDVDLQQAIDTVLRAGALRLIYPDGTVNDTAFQVGAKLVGRRLRLMAGETIGKKKAEYEDDERSE